MIVLTKNVLYEFSVNWHTSLKSLDTFHHNLQVYHSLFDATTTHTTCPFFLIFTGVIGNISDKFSKSILTRMLLSFVLLLIFKEECLTLISCCKWSTYTELPSALRLQFIKGIKLSWLIKLHLMNPLCKIFPQY